MSSLGAALLLADGRFPAGGHAHSGGYEAASSAYALDSPARLSSYLVGRLHTVGRCEAAQVAAVLERSDRSREFWDELDTEVDARSASPALRTTSRTLGRQWLRAGRRIWPSPHYRRLSRHPDGPHQTVAFAVVAEAGGLGSASAVSIHLHNMVAATATAAIRLQGMDPFEIQNVQRDLLALKDEVAVEAIELGRRPLSELPGGGATLPDLLAEDHARWDLRLFQS